MQNPILFKTKNYLLEKLPNGLQLTSTGFSQVKNSSLSRLKFFGTEMIILLLFLLVAVVVGYFTLYRTAIDCERTNAKEPAVCDITKHYYFGPNEIVLSKTPIYSMRLEHETSSSASAVCRLKATTANHQTILPLGEIYSSQLCHYNNEINEAKALLDFEYQRPELGKVKFDMADNFFLGLGYLCRCLYL